MVNYLRAYNFKRGRALVRFLVLGLGASLFFSWFLQGADTSSYFISFKDNLLVEETDTFCVPETFNVAACESHIEGSASREELQALTGLFVGAFLTREQFLKGIERLRQKNIFSQISFTFKEVSGTDRKSFNVSCTATCNWIIKSIKFTGVFSGKNEYLSLYQAAAGDLFLQEKHACSLEFIRTFFNDLGYKNAEVLDAFSFDYSLKTVGIQLTVKKQDPFIINQVDVEFIAKNCRFTEQEKEFFGKELFKLHRKVCKKKGIVKVINRTKALLEKAGFVDPVIDYKEVVVEGQNRMNLFFTVTVADKKQVAFIGNVHFSSSELKKRVFDFFEKELFLPSFVVAQEIVAEYYKKGFWKASVNAVEDQEGYEIFTINEGVRVALKKVIFATGTTYEPEWLSKRFFSKIIKARYFDEEKMQEAIKSLLQWYKEQGFWDVALVKKEYQLLDEPKLSYGLIIFLEEGKRYCIKGLAVEGIDSVPKDFPLHATLKGSDQYVPLGFETFLLQKQFFLKLLRKEGYLNARVTSVFKNIPEGVGVTWRCEKGERVLFGKVILRGLTTLSYPHVTKLLAFEEGDVWGKDKIQQSLVGIRSLDIFERVTMFPSFQNVDLNQRDMIVMVKDDDPFELKLRMGFAQVSKNFYFKKGSTYKAGGSFSWKNPLNRADKCTLDIDFNRYERKINVSYKIPLLGDYPVLTVVKGYSNKYIQPIYIGSSKPLYQVLQEGFLVGLSKKYAHCDMGLTSGFEWMETTDISVAIARAINFETNLINKKIPYFFVEPMVYADFLDDKVFPTKGFFGMTAMKGMFPFKETTYFVKMLMEYGTFVSLHTMVLAMRVRGGHIFRRKFDAIMPPERFFLGGPFSLRGYLQDYCPPLGAYVDQEGMLQNVPQGGKSMFNANFEIRLPTHDKIAWAAIFQDFGILIEGSRMLFSSGTPLASTGFGIRYMTPVGPLRFDIGWKWHRSRPDESPYAWFLTFGNAF